MSMLSNFISSAMTQRKNNCVWPYQVFQPSLIFVGNSRSLHQNCHHSGMLWLCLHIIDYPETLTTEETL